MKIYIDQSENSLDTVSIYANKEGDTIEFRKSTMSKAKILPGRSQDGTDYPLSTLTFAQLKMALAQAAYNWLCSYCMEEMTGTEPDMDWPGFHPGTCELCKRKLVVFTTTEE